MRICVYGLGHLGVVTSACLASLGHDVCGLDDDPVNIDALNQAVMPVFEPGLQNLIQTGIAQRRLRFTTQKTEAVAGVPILWVAFDTPVDEADRADIAFVSGKIKSVLPVLENGSLIVVSTQMPVGSIRKLEAFAKQEFDDKSLRFACCPENLRLGNAVDLFLHPDRIVAGARTAEDITLLTELLTSISTSIEWMSVESAEMTKHAINAFLGMSIAFTNEIASICELAGADAREVERGLRSEARIGRQAYVAPGGAFAAAFWRWAKTAPRTSPPLVALVAADRKALDTVVAAAPAKLDAATAKPIIETAARSGLPRFISRKRWRR